MFADLFDIFRPAHKPDYSDSGQIVECNDPVAREPVAYPVHKLRPDGARHVSRRLVAETDASADDTNLPTPVESKDESSQVVEFNAPHARDPVAYPMYKPRPDGARDVSRYVVVETAAPAEDTSLPVLVESKEESSQVVEFNAPHARDPVSYPMYKPRPDGARNVSRYVVVQTDAPADDTNLPVLVESSEESSQVVEFSAPHARDPVAYPMYKPRPDGARNVSRHSLP